MMFTIVSNVNEFFDGNHIADKPPNGAGTLMRMSILKDLGGYREDLGAQDGLDIWTRIENKFAVKNVNLPLFYYRRHDSKSNEKFVSYNCGSSSN